MKKIIFALIVMSLFLVACNVEDKTIRPAYKDELANLLNGNSIQNIHDFDYSIVTYNEKKVNLTYNYVVDENRHHLAVGTYTQNVPDSLDTTCTFEMGTTKNLCSCDNTYAKCDSFRVDASSLSDIRREHRDLSNVFNKEDVRVKKQGSCYMFEDENVSYEICFEGELLSSSKIVGVGFDKTLIVN